MNKARKVEDRMLKQIFISASSASFELENTACYDAPEPYEIYLNGVFVEKCSRNVCSLFGLVPDTEYEVMIKTSSSEEVLNFHTDYVTATLNVKDFYAFGNGIHDDTQAIQAAILSCPKNGKIYIPEGTYLVTALFLKSDIQMELAENAVLLGETDRHKYPVLPGVIPTANGDEWCLGTWEGEPDDIFASTITGISIENVKLYGKGVIDENAHNSDWWVNHRVKRVARRPKGIFLNHCKNIALHGITVKNTPAWNQHPFFSKDISYIDVSLMSPKNSPTTDGCDPESCHNVKIIGCHFSVGDDCIAIKSGKIDFGRRFQTPSEQIIIRNCLMEFGHGGVTLGSEMSGGIKDVTVTQCIFRDTDRGLRIKSRRGRGDTAVIDNITFENIRMERVLAPLTMNMFYKAGSEAFVPEHFDKNPQPVDETTPYLGNFVFRNLNVTDAQWGAGYFLGLPEQPIESVTIENVTFEMSEEASEGVIIMTPDSPKVCRQGLYFENVNRVVLTQTQVLHADGEEVICKNVHEKIENSYDITKKKDWNPAESEENDV